VAAQAHNKVTRETEIISLPQEITVARFWGRGDGHLLSHLRVRTRGQARRVSGSPPSSDERVDLRYHSGHHDREEGYLRSILEITMAVYKEREQTQGRPGTPEGVMETETGEGSEGCFRADCLITGFTREPVLS